MGACPDDPLTAVRVSCAAAVSHQRFACRERVAAVLMLAAT
jgi:hypothetical protein